MAIVWMGHYSTILKDKSDWWFAWIIKNNKILNDGFTHWVYVEWNDWIEISINEWFDSEIEMVNSMEISLPFSLPFWLFWDLSDKEENNREKEEYNLSPISCLFWYEIKREWD